MASDAVGMALLWR